MPNLIFHGAGKETLTRDRSAATGPIFNFQRGQELDDAQYQLKTTDFRRWILVGAGKETLTPGLFLGKEAL
jgi:hypothetical protein